MIAVLTIYDAKWSEKNESFNWIMICEEITLG